MSYNPQTGLVYIPVLDIPATYGQPDDYKYNPGVHNLGIDMVIGGLPDDQAERDAVGALVQGRLVAWDPVRQEEAWRVEHRGAWNGGTLTTAGNLVFQGTADGNLVAYRADNGEKLWEFATQTGVVAPPISYEIDGEQYISINVGWGGAFALVFGEFVQNESMPNVSRVLSFKLCMGCHGLNAVSGLLIPDLRGSAYLWDAEGWDEVVRGGKLKDKGMASFANNFGEVESQALRAYVIAQSHRGLAVQKAAAEKESTLSQ
jgi:hypothetical protein